MATLLGTSFSSDEKIVSQSDTKGLRSFAQSLVIKLDQAKFEEFTSSYQSSMATTRSYRRMHHSANLGLKSILAHVKADFAKDNLSFAGSQMNFAQSETNLTEDSTNGGRANFAQSEDNPSFAHSRANFAQSEDNPSFAYSKVNLAEDNPNFADDKANFAESKTSLSENSPSLAEDSPNFARGRANFTQSNPNFTQSEANHARSSLSVTGDKMSFAPSEILATLAQSEGQDSQTSLKFGCKSTTFLGVLFKVSCDAHRDSLKVNK